MLTSDDIERFIAPGLASNATFQYHEQNDPELPSQIVKDVSGRSKGVFLWV